MPCACTCVHVYLLLLLVVCCCPVYMYMPPELAKPSGWCPFRLRQFCVVAAALMRADGWGLMLVGAGLRCYTSEQFKLDQTLLSSMLLAGGAHTLAPALGQRAAAPPFLIEAQPLAFTSTKTQHVRHEPNSTRKFPLLAGVQRPAAASPLPRSHAVLSPLASKGANQLAHIGLPADDSVCKCW